MLADEQPVAVPMTSGKDDAGAIPAAASVAEEERAAALLPLTIGGVFDEAFDLYKRHFSILALIVGIGFIPVQIALHAISATWLSPLTARAKEASGDAAILPWSLVIILGLLVGDPEAGMPGLISIATLVMISAPVTIAVSELYIEGRTSLRRAYRGAIPYFVPLLGRYILVALAFAGVMFVTTFVVSILAFMLGLIVTVVPRAMQSLAGNIVGVIVLGAFFLLPYAVGCGLAAKFFAFMTPLTVFEGASISQVQVRNAQLVGQRRFWSTAGALTFLPIITFGFQGIILATIGQTLDQLHLPAAGRFGIETLTTTSISFFLQPYWMIFLTLLYYNYRVQRDGLDLRVLAARLRPSLMAQEAE